MSISRAGQGKTVIAWSCGHSSPETSNERFDWLGGLIHDIKPDYCVDLGDGADIKSLNSYDTKKPKNLVAQSYERDIASYNESQDLLRYRFKKSKRSKPSWYGFEGNHECFQGHTEVFVKGKGWVYAPQVSKGDEVMSLTGVWEPVQETHKLWHEGPMYSYQSQTGSFTVTPNHRVYYYTSQGNLIVKEAKDTPNTLDLPVSVRNKELKLTGLTDSELKFNAIALTDSFHKGSKITFYQSGDKALVVEQIIKDCGIEYRKVVRDRDIKAICGVELKSTQIGYEFHMDRPDWCVDQNKTIPSEFFQLTEDQAEIFLDMLIFCDGSPMVDRGSSVFYGQKKICGDVQAFCQFNGHRASVTEYRPNQYRVNINPRNKQRFNKKIEAHTEDWVFCLTVESGSFLARQGGVSMFTGNCRIKTAISFDPRLEGKKYGISFEHLQTNKWFNEYHQYENGAPAIHNYDGVDYAHYVGAGNFGRAISGMHHAYGLLQKRYCSVSVGHSHKRGMYFKDDVGSNGIIGSVLGCYKGAPESWAGQANKEWWTGVVIKRNVADGMYEPQWISMDTLRKEYGNKQ